MESIHSGAKEVVETAQKEVETNMVAVENSSGHVVASKALSIHSEAVSRIKVKAGVLAVRSLVIGRLKGANNPYTVRQLLVRCSLCYCPLPRVCRTGRSTGTSSMRLQ